MALRNLSFPEVVVQTPGGNFVVRGLSTDMVLGLYNRHRGQLSTLFDHVVGKHQDGLLPDPGTVITSAMQSAPDIAVEIIALASGSKPTDDHVDPETGLTYWESDLAMARQMSLPVQVDALEKIFAQTFTEAMPVGKFLAVVIKAAGDATAVLPNPKS